MTDGNSGRRERPAKSSYPRLIALKLDKLEPDKLLDEVFKRVENCTDRAFDALPTPDSPLRRPFPPQRKRPAET